MRARGNYWVKVHSFTVNTQPAGFYNTCNNWNSKRLKNLLLKNVTALLLISPLPLKGEGEGTVMMTQ